MFRKSGIFILAVGMGFLLMGAVVKRKDPIQRTQTDPVGYQDKLKEEADGKKGPPVPTIELFPKEGFLSEGPVEAKKKTSDEPAEEEAEFELAAEEGTEERAEEEGRQKLDEEFKLEPETDDMWEETLDFDVEEVEADEGAKELTKPSPKTRSVIP